MLTRKSEDLCNHPGKTPFHINRKEKIGIELGEVGRPEEPTKPRNGGTKKKYSPSEAW